MANRSSLRNSLVAGAAVGGLCGAALWLPEWLFHFRRHFAWTAEPLFRPLLLGLTAYGFALYSAAGAAAGLPAGAILRPLRRGYEFALPLLLGLPVFAFHFVFVNKNCLPKITSPASIAGNGAFALACILFAALLTLLVRRHRRGGTGAPVLGRILAGQIAAAALLAAGAAAWWGATAPERNGPWRGGERRPPNVVIFLLETTRADHLGCYGYERNTSPHMDRIAGEGMLFENYYVAAPFSGPSKATLHTGLYPHHNGVRSMPQRILRGATTLAEVFRANGYETAGFASGVFMGPEFDYHKGFRTYEALGTPYDLLRFRTALGGLELVLHRWTPWYLSDEERYERVGAGRGVSLALEWIDRAGGAPFFCLFELNEPHFTYVPPPPFANRFGDPAPGLALMEDYEARRVPRYDLIYAIERTGYTEADLRSAVDLYDGEIAWADDAIGRFRRGLEERGLFDRTIVVVTADHGENFGDHGTWFEHTYLYDSSLRVPMMLRYPPAVPVRRVHSTAAEVDLFPTLLDLAGLRYDGPLDGAGMMGKAERDTSDRPVFAEDDIYRDPRLAGYPRYRTYFPGVIGKWRMIREGDWKLIYIPGPEGPEYELYHLPGDPRELHDLHGERPDVAEPLRLRLEEWMAEDERGDADVREELREEMIEQLRSLGYIQ
ncbi:MAG: sulfatase [Candidatus Eisenbacteria bacterium]